MSSGTRKKSPAQTEAIIHSRVRSGASAIWASRTTTSVGRTMRFGIKRRSGSIRVTDEEHPYLRIEGLDRRHGPRRLAERVARVENDEITAVPLDQVHGTRHSFSGFDREVASRQEETCESQKPVVARAEKDADRARWRVAVARAGVRRRRLWRCRDPAIQWARCPGDTVSRFQPATGSFAGSELDHVAGAPAGG